MWNKKSNKILMQKRNRTKLWPENIPKINVEQTKGSEESYLYLYSFGT
jgi:hypothetical protein